MTTLPPEAARCVVDWLGEGWTARPLAGDASVRAYYRLSGPDRRSYILAYYPEEVRGQLRHFLAAYEAVSPHARVPQVMQSCDFAVLQRDVADRTLYGVLHENREEGLKLYRSAIEMLAGFQNAKADLNPPFTAEFFRNELRMAQEFYVEKLMGGAVDGRGAELELLFDKLCDKVASHPYVLCHRDYHGQNLHIIEETIYLIDYQDLRMGPDTYDMASLLRDRGVARIIGDPTELELLAYYGSLKKADDGLRCRYFETLLQRSVKILGTFSKQPITRGRMHYLDFIPPTLESVRRCIEELPELASLRQLLPMDFSLERARDRARELNASS